ncbi:MAG: chloride channel protein [Deltaproteobacteria bacterium]|nr:chloride channel protein [Deltaproteobacteria bacterium]
MARERPGEDAVIFVSVVKWTALALCVGLITGASTWLLVWTLDRGAAEAERWWNYYFLLMPAGLLASGLIIKYLAPRAAGHGAAGVIDAIHRRSGRIRPIQVPVEFARTFLTIVSGGSAGKEGPSAQIGAGLASIFADGLRLNDGDRRKAVICGVSGGFASVFGTPIAGAVFGMECLFVGSMRYDALLPSFVTGVVSYQVSSWLGLTYLRRTLGFAPAFSGVFFMKILFAGVCFGVVSIIFIETLAALSRISGRLAPQVYAKAALGGAALVGIAFLSGGTSLGLGVDVIRAALEGSFVFPSVFLWKSLATAVTLGFGGHGGIGTPIFFVGAASGSALSPFIGLDTALLSSIGFVALLAGAANTPIAASIMAAELFGPGIAPYAAVACVISYVISGHRSAYPTQRIDVAKSPSLEVERGAAVEGQRPVYVERQGSLIRVVSAAVEFFRKGKGR